MWLQIQAVLQMPGHNTKSQSQTHCVCEEILDWTFIISFEPWMDFFAKNCTTTELRWDYGVDQDQTH